MREDGMLVLRIGEIILQGWKRMHIEERQTGHSCFRNLRIDMKACEKICGEEWKKQHGKDEVAVMNGMNIGLENLRINVRRNNGTSLHVKTKQQR